MHSIISDLPRSIYVVLLDFFSAGMVEKMERDKTNASFNGLKKCNYDEEGEKKQWILKKWVSSKYATASDKSPKIFLSKLRARFFLLRFASQRLLLHSHF